MIFTKIRNVIMIFPDCLNVETFLTHRLCTRQLRTQILRHMYMTYKKYGSHGNQKILIQLVVMKQKRKMTSGMMI